jgi:hypothetical protein
LHQQARQLHLPHKYKMILRELFYIDPNTRDLGNELRYSPQRDDTMLRTDDTRKTRLTLKQINELRKSSEAHILEQENELEFIHSMYAAPPAAPQ